MSLARLTRTGTSVISGNSEIDALPISVESGGVGWVECSQLEFRDSGIQLLGEPGCLFGTIK